MRTECEEPSGPPEAPPAAFDKSLYAACRYCRSGRCSECCYNPLRDEPEEPTLQ